MSRKLITSRFGCLVALAIASAVWDQRGQADIDIGTTDASNGALTVSSNTTLNLATAVTGTWSDSAPNASTPIYDAQMWAVVYKFSSVTINNGAYVSFNSHPSGAPVVWLVQGNCTINGNVFLDGYAHTGCAAQPTGAPPGGFSGGAGSYAIGSGGGYGPGGGGVAVPGGDCDGSAGSFGTAGTHGPQPGPTYGNPELIPLIGGSGGGGAGFYGCLGGGGGGGAILIAVRGTLTVNGGIYARGGGAAGQNGCDAGGGSGGGIRLVADVVAGSTSATLRAEGGSFGGGTGRIRIDGNNITYSGNSSPTYTFSLVGPTAVIWPPRPVPRVKITSIAGIAVPADPENNLTFPNADVLFDTTDPVPVLVEATNVPTNSTVTVRVVAKNGPDQKVNATLVGGNRTMSTWQADIVFGPNFSTVQARAVLPPAEPR